MFYPEMAASFQYIVESDQVGRNIGIGIVYTVTHTCLSPQIDCNVRGIFLKYRRYCLFVSQIPFHKSIAGELF